MTKRLLCINIFMKGVFQIARNLRIKVARAEKDMTQKALAEAVGISRSEATQGSGSDERQRHALTLLKPRVSAAMAMAGEFYKFPFSVQAQ